MHFTETKLKGSYLVDPTLHKDDRGGFARTWCANEFEEHGLPIRIRQCNLSFNFKKGTLRGLHYQAPPLQEAKLIRCTRGSIFDVIVDIRVNSPTFLEWLGYELTSENFKALYVPEGFAHGYQTLEDDVEVSYQVSEFYSPEASCELRWSDPRINIKWPLEPTAISDKDAHAPLVSDLFPFCSPNV